MAAVAGREESDVAGVREGALDDRRVLAGQGRPDPGAAGQGQEGEREDDPSWPAVAHWPYPFRTDATVGSLPKWYPTPRNIRNCVQSLIAGRFVLDSR